MVPIRERLEPGPDGMGWWPEAFAIDDEWVSARGSAWRAVLNYPTLQARRNGDLLDLRQTDDLVVHTYRLEQSDINAYIASKENS